MSTVWVLIIMAATGGTYHNTWATSQQIGPYPTKAACEFVKNEIPNNSVWRFKRCLPRMKTKADVAP